MMDGINTTLQLPTDPDRVKVIIFVVDVKGRVVCVDIDLPRRDLAGEHQNLDIGYLQPAFAAIRQRVHP